MQLNLHPAPKLITFDTYGTLIDWESAIVSFIADALAKKDEHLDATTFYRVWYYGFALPAIKGPYMPYQKLLHCTFQQALEAHRVPVLPSDGEGLGDAMAVAEPFPDAIAALSRLRVKYRLATIRNSQDNIICHAVDKLKHPFEFVITGETTHTYTPNPALFELVLAKAGVTRAETIHVAQSQYVDLPRSVRMGIRTVWINRQRQQLRKETPAPDAELADLLQLPELLNT
jgi:2-haloacid dehalogenase